MKFISNLDNEALLVAESLLSTANGYIGIRGNFEEGYKEDDDTIRGSYINAFHEIVDVTYGENAYGFPQHAQKLLNIVDAQTILVYIDGEMFSLFRGEVLLIERELELEKGYAIRKVRWKSPKGHIVDIIIKRMTSFVMRELFLIEYSIKSINFSGNIEIISTLKGDVVNYTRKNDPRVASGHDKLLNIHDVKLQEDCGIINGGVNRAGLNLSCIVKHDIKMEYKILDLEIIGVHKCSLAEGESLSFTKFVVYTDSLRHEDLINDGIGFVKEAFEKGTIYWFEKQKEYLDEFWKYAYVNIEGDTSSQEAVLFSIYQLLCSTGKDPHSNLSAKGLSGEGYEGHYFWDTEIYGLPFFTLTNPSIAKNLLTFRYTTLDKAREEARLLGHKSGAKIPWRTISGSECSAYFPAGTAQYHINADVAYSNIQYYLFSKDLEFMFDVSYEVIFETARLWMNTGHFQSTGEFCIDAVTGPDEYTAIVNNNYFTNAMAKYHLKWTVKLANILEKRDKRRWEQLKSKLEMTGNELEFMSQAEKKMYLPFDEVLRISVQDDSFMTKKDWDFENTPKDKYPLLLHFHPLTIYRHKVMKQADTVLAHLLLDNESEEVIRNSFAYYEKYTTHDSSLSYCIYGMMASRIQDTQKAFRYFNKNVRLDLDNLHHNTRDGLHIANAGGVYMSVIYGFGGLRIKEDGIHLRPTKPKEWKSYSFRIYYQGNLVKVTVSEVLRIECETEIEVKVFDILRHIKKVMVIDLNTNEVT